MVDLSLGQQCLGGREVAARRAFLLRSLRWHDEGRDHSRYLRAALASKFEVKTFAAWAASAAFGVKR